MNTALMTQDAHDLCGDPPSLIYPVYGAAALGMAYQEIAKRFHERAKAIIQAPGPSLKKIALRNVHDDGERLSRDLCLAEILDGVFWAVMDKYLEHPTGWVGNPLPEQKQAAIAELKHIFFVEQWPLVRHIIREAPRAQWLEAAHSCSDSECRQCVEEIFRAHIPVPGIAGNQMVENLIKELQGFVEIAVWKLKFPGGIQ